MKCSMAALTCRAAAAANRSDILTNPHPSLPPAACNVGFYVNATTNRCVACPVNTTTTATGSLLRSDCSICTNGNYGTGPTSCAACPSGKAVPAGQLRPTSSNDCVCKAGTYVDASGNCLTQCPANFYVSADGRTCASCPITPGVSTNPQPNTKTSCLCPAGFIWDAATSNCIACGSGAITTTIGNTSPTQCACPANTYGAPAPGGSGCGPCPANSVRPGSSSADTSTTGCTCDWGYYWDAGACTPCGIDANTTVVGATSSSQCACPKGYYGDPTLACTSCGVSGTTDGPSTSITTVGNCICEQNYYGGGVVTECTACPTNAITLTDGANIIESCGCPAGYFGFGSDAAVGCAQCPTGSTTPWTTASFDDTSQANYACVCPKNTYFQITSSAGTAPVAACTPCPSGAITATSGSTAVGQCGCPNNWWGDPATTGCSICPTNGTRSGFTLLASTECTCDKGYYWSTSLCIKCPPLATTNAKGTLVVGDCGCPANFFTPNTGLPSTTGCSACPANSFRKVVTAGSTVDLGASTSCTCNVNYYWTSSNTCNRCPTGAVTDPTVTTGGTAITDCGELRHSV